MVDVLSHIGKNDNIEVFDVIGSENPFHYRNKIIEPFAKKAISLLNRDGLAYMFNNATHIFTGFDPLGTVLVAMLGVGVAEWAGLFDASLKRVLLNANPKFLTPLVIFIGIMSNIASDAGYVVVIPIGALIFALAGRHPLAGIAAAFAGVSGGFSANLVLGTTDPLLTGITNQALTASGIDMQLAPTCNWYFLAVSTIFLTVVGTFITDKIVEKNLGKYSGEYTPDDTPLTDLQNKGLRNALIGLIIYIAIMAFLMFPENAVFRAAQADGQKTLKAFLHSGSSKLSSSNSHWDVTCPGSRFPRPGMPFPPSPSPHSLSVTVDRKSTRLNSSH